MYLVTNISGRVQSAPKTLVGIALAEQVNNWQIGQQDFVDDSVIQYYQGHSDVYTINAGPSLNPILLNAVPAAVPTAQAATVSNVDSSTGLHTSVLTLVNAVVPMTLDGTNAYGGLEILDLPQANIVILGATSNLTVATGKKASSGILAGASLVGSVGTVTAPAAITLTTTAANIIPSTASTLTAYAGAMPGKSTSTQLAVIDGDTTALKLFLNFACGTANTTTDSVIVNGTITVVWAPLGLD